jgi:hypothetical protein
MNSTGKLNMSFIDMVGQPKLNAWSFRELAPSELHFVSGGDDGGGCGPGDCGDCASGGDSVDIPNYPGLFAKLFGY